MATQSKNKKKKNGPFLKEVLARIGDEQTLKDSRALIKIMRKISGRQPKIWNAGTIGFDSYRFKYDSGREGDGHALGFYPRKGKITGYLMDGTKRHSKLLDQLGKCTTSRVCVYIKRLSDIELEILEKILHQSYRFLKTKDGSVRRVE